MKRKYAFLVVAAALAVGAQAKATILPDACGDDKVNFGVKTEKDQPPPPAPEAGKAQVVVVESIDTHEQLCLGCSVITRLGLDGQWIGATKGNSYLVLAISPGDHHLCAGWQSNVGRMRSKVGVASFSAEPGKVYYYRVKIVMKRIDDPNPESTLEVSPMSEDEGKYAVKVSALSKPRQGR